MAVTYRLWSPVERGGFFCISGDDVSGLKDAALVSNCGNGMRFDKGKAQLRALKGGTKRSCQPERWKRTLDISQGLRIRRFQKGSPRVESGFTTARRTRMETGAVQYRKEDR